MKPIESQRVTVDRKVVLRFPDFDGFMTDYADNLSMTGMFIKTTEPQPVGTPLSFELRLVDGAPLVRGSGWVVWARSKREARDRPAGMGIEFTELDRRSRRLVRWLVLRQLADEGGEFDVQAGTASAPLTDAVATSRAVRRRRLYIASAVSLGVVGLLGARLWLGGGGEPAIDLGRGQPPPADEPATRARAPLEPTLIEQPPPSEEEPPEPRARAEAARREEAVELVRSWAAAWSAQDVGRYLGHYSATFVPEGGLPLSEWRAQRRQRLTAPASIRVAVTRLEARLLSESEARVTFLQTYRSEGYADTVDKVLELVREEGAWRIRRELAG